MHVIGSPPCRARWRQHDSNIWRRQTRRDLRFGSSDHSLNPTFTTYGRISIRKILVGTGPNSSSPPAYPYNSQYHSLFVFAGCIGEADLLAALTEYERYIDLLESLYNYNIKGVLDQIKLGTDLRSL